MQNDPTCICEFCEISEDHAVRHKGLGLLKMPKVFGIFCNTKGFER